MLLCRLKELGHMVAVTARRATGHLCRAPGPVVIQSVQTTDLGSLTEEPCSKLWRQTVLSQALQMRGARCLTLKGLRDCSSQKEGQSRGPSVYLPLFWRGPEGAQLLLIQSFPVLEVVLQVPHKVRQVNKGIPGIKHVCDEVVDEGDLRLGDAAGVSVEHWHHHRQVQLFLFIGL